ncbi:hypothetical protein SLE2022_240110 [Rubroshorea leprosula]
MVLGDPFISTNTCIFRVPDRIKMQNARAYEPYAFSLGPWHFGKQHLMDAQKFKIYFLQGLVRRFPNPDSKVEELEQVIKDVQSRACECYGDWAAINVTKEEFEKILMLDGCFIIELLRKLAAEIPIQEGDSTFFSSNAMYPVLFHDLFLLENQIPWFVLELLYDRTSGNGSKPLAEIATEFFIRFAFSHDKLQTEPEILSSIEIKHILDLARHYLGLSSEVGSSVFQLYKHTIPSATRLKEAGVKFKRVESRRILDVRFKNGVLEIPTLLIYITSEAIFRNLISFEQCCPFYAPRVACYARLLDGLVDTPDDVNILSRAGIFNNWLTVKDASRLFDGLNNGNSIPIFYYAELCEQVNAYCQRWWPKWRAFYIHNYFSKPWAIVSQAFAIAILVLTFLQAFHCK